MDENQYLFKSIRLGLVLLEYVASVEERVCMLPQEIYIKTDLFVFLFFLKNSINITISSKNLSLQYILKKKQPWGYC